MSEPILRRGLLVLMLVAGFAIGAVAQQPDKLQGFPTAEAAANALTEAIRKDDDKTVSKILGSGWRDFVTGSAEDEDRVRAKFLAAWDENHKVVVTDNKAAVEVGTTDWVSPIPIVKDGTEWRFDIEAGRKEMITRNRPQRARRDADAAAIVDAQRDYASLDPMKTGVPTYARRC